MSEREQVTVADFKAEAIRRFGEKANNWKYICPKCKTVQCYQDFVDAGVDPEEAKKRIGFSCIGRVVKGVGCDWSLGGLFQIHDLELIDEDGSLHPHFELAPAEVEKTDG